VKAEMAMGTEVSVSLRRRAVTMMSSLPGLAAGLSCAAAVPGIVPSATVESRKAQIGRIVLLAMVLSLRGDLGAPASWRDNIER
jgi:hypothetical protein